MKSQPKAVERADWYWCGFPGHYIVAHKCRFHLHTRVGNVIVSSVGAKLEPDQERHDQCQDVGAGRKYETFVFLAEDFILPSGSVRPEGQIFSLSEIDAVGSNDSEEAERNHYELCERWSSKEKQIEAYNRICDILVEREIELTEMRDED